MEKLKVLCGGQKYGGKGFFIQPTIFTDVPETSKLATEEIFGPVLCIMKPWKKIDDVITLINQSSFGLSCIALSNNINACEKI